MPCRAALLCAAPVRCPTFWAFSPRPLGHPESCAGCHWLGQAPRSCELMLLMYAIRRADELRALADKSWLDSPSRG
ncbi:hypothetical protein BDY21DRAFT_352602 [Lineolata rhizophorae]|uniref:Uncharacterized protein n=1 Tax=Lineolata rhizophorae TaxID=578093 RepID=A0A6A6NSP5_9PEZI|nr:hypothetical protein BDY21DRAFT_352602 [Lineolata rhizophorae]